MSTTSQAANIFARLRAIAPDVKATSKLRATATHRDTIEDARAKVAAKLRANKLYIIDSSNERPDTVYKEQRDNTYAVGVKYGNRYLEGVFDGSTYITSLNEGQLPEVLEMLAETAEEGTFDDAIRKIMLANVAAKNKA